MKKALLLFVLFPLYINAQTKSVSISQSLEKKLVKASEYFAAGENEKAVEKWKKVEDKAKKTTSTYGKAIRHLFQYYSFYNSPSILQEYYKKAMKFNLNTYEKGEDIGQSFLNFKYHSTIKMARFYYSKGDFEKAVYYINIADKKLTYQTNSLTIFSNKKIDLAMWKYRIYKAAENDALAISQLIQRAFEYNYQSLKKDWVFVSDKNNEDQLTSLIFKEITDLDAFKNKINKAIDAAQLHNNKIVFQIDAIKYQIDNPANLDVLSAKRYLYESPFYKALYRLKELPNVETE